MSNTTPPKLARHRTTEGPPGASGLRLRLEHRERGLVHRRSLARAAREAAKLLRQARHGAGRGHRTCARTKKSTFP